MWPPILCGAAWKIKVWSCRNVGETIHVIVFCSGWLRPWRMRFEFELVESATWFSAWCRWISKHHMFRGIWEKDQDYVRTDYGRWKDKVPIQKFWCESSREVEMRMYFRTSVCADTCARLLTHASRFATTTRCSCCLGTVSPRLWQMKISFFYFFEIFGVENPGGGIIPEWFFRIGAKVYKPWARLRADPTLDSNIDHYPSPITHPH